MAEFAYNNPQQASTMMSLFGVLLSHHPLMFHKDNRDPQSKSQMTNENAIALRNLMKKLNMDFAKSKELQALYHNKNIKKCLYWPRKFVKLSGKQIKTKGFSKLEHKYLGFFEI